MKHYKYIGFFRTSDGVTFTMEEYAIGFRDAYYLLIAKAINSGKSYSLISIADENGKMKMVKDIESMQIFI